MSFLDCSSCVEGAATFYLPEGAHEALISHYDSQVTDELTSKMTDRKGFQVKPERDEGTESERIPHLQLKRCNEQNVDAY